MAGLVVGACGGGGGSNSGSASSATMVVAALPLPGPFAVACSNISQDFTRLAPGEDVSAYWEGAPSASGPRYLTSLLADPANTLSVTVNAPNDSNLYGSFAGTAVPFVLLTCYPTIATNPRLDYLLPTGAVVPHMQTGIESPVFASATSRYPLLLFSHGYSGSPLSKDYPAILSMFASYGYVVVAPFHGDPRFSDLGVDNLADAVRVLSSLRDFVALQALRPLSMSAALDLMLAHPQWRDHIDANQIGGFGASMGGESLALMGGAQLTTSLGFSSNRVTMDARLKAAVGYVPYFGQPFLPAFGRDQQGLDGVALPYLAIAGTADTTAPLLMTQQGISRLAGTRELVTLVGVKHTFDVASTNDIFTWSLVFLDAMVQGHLASQQQLASMASVAGGGDDRVVIGYNGPR
jgi:predicted dienelactone hydrolase